MPKVELLALLVDSIFVDNLALSFFLGMCTLLAVSRTVPTALGLGAAVTVVQVITVPLNNLVHRYLLEDGAWSWAGLPEVDLRYLGLMVYIAVIAAAVQVLEMLLERFFPDLHRAMGLFLPLLTVNCAILGGSLFMVEREYGFTESAVFGLGTGFGWALAVALLAGIREKLRYADVPEGLRGLGLNFIVVGLMSLGFLALADIRLG
jgi:Na+-transporting NADH:ubiquinone oxidoreductase subunit E